jgi:hypothetical protein
MPKIEECLIDVDLAKAIRNVAGALELKADEEFVRGGKSPLR